MSATEPTTVTTWAIENVARHALAAAVRLHPPEWEDYPDVGEHDWTAVEAEVERMAQQLDTEHYESAYRHLAGRAEGEPA